MDRREAIVSAFKKLGILDPSQDEIDTACNQLDGLSSPTDGSFREAIEICAAEATKRADECKKHYAKKMTRLSEPRGKSK